MENAFLVTKAYDKLKTFKINLSFSTYSESENKFYFNCQRVIKEDMGILFIEHKIVFSYE